MATRLLRSQGLVKSVIFFIDWVFIVLTYKLQFQKKEQHRAFRIAVIAAREAQSGMAPGNLISGQHK